ncbi:cytochrome c family protein [Roseomonas sp. CECT 9278]|uniref:c-type cytochrome n=1 Tax=Roseomonas sp. CECT 9278 TaxID=2845823 RepID=UPI001E2ADC91|nr:c-type cytochrome [Roseomonas sp. CECT 9278]CAH0174736.1 Cytochrome c2 [Roseomonas sp. CECT 9278]
MLGLVATLVAAAPAAAQDGRAVFDARCASCHALSADAPAAAGPHLAGLAGRRIGGDPAFDYSPALREAQGTWDAARLDRFLTDPEEMFPGLWMGGNGIAQAAQRRAVVDFLTGR